MRDDPIVVLSQPRAGSTLAVRLLNLDPGVMLMGEHGGFIRHISSAFRAFTEGKAKGEYKPDMPDNELRELVKRPNDFSVATAGGVRTGDVQNAARLFVEAVGNPLRHDIRWGFKEVVTSGVGYLVCELFPKAQIICMVRDPVDCIRSINDAGWWGRHLEWIIRDIWLEPFRGFHALAATYPGQVEIVRYENMASRFPEVFNWLNLPWGTAHQEMLAGERVGASDKVGMRIYGPITDAEADFIRKKCAEYYSP